MERDAMVSRQIAARGVSDERVLEAMRTVPRHRFVPERLARSAYADRADPRVVPPPGRAGLDPPAPDLSAHALSVYTMEGIPRRDALRH